MTPTRARTPVRSILAIILAMLLAVVTGAAASAYANSVTYRGQGLIADGFGGYDLRTELCSTVDDEGNVQLNGADVEGPYLLFVLTATGANNADITGPWGTAGMTKTGNGTFKYISAWYDPGTLPGEVSATYDGKAKNAQLVISHGCRPFETEGAWCSPGFWMNARDGAWALTEYDRTDLFNDTVYDVWYGATFEANPTLKTVLDNPNTYSGPPLAGTSGHALNAFNATGAMLTDSLEEFHFDWDVMMAGGSDACPIDSFGNLK